MYILYLIGIHNTTRCQTPNNSFGECVNIFQCPSFMKFLAQRKVVTEQEKIALRLYICGASLKDQKICCAEEDVNIGNSPISIMRTNLWSTNGN